jgi:hypothetical protein
LFDVSHINFYFISSPLCLRGKAYPSNRKRDTKNKNRKIVAYDSVFFDFYGLGVVFLFLVSLGAKVDSPPDLSHVGGRRKNLKKKKKRSRSVVRQCLFPVSQDARRPVPTTTTHQHHHQHHQSYTEKLGTKWA